MALKNVLVEVISQQGVCVTGHRTGDKWVIQNKTVDGLCAAAFVGMYGCLFALNNGALLSWANTDGTSVEIACPDRDNPVVFQLTMLPDDAEE